MGAMWVSLPKSPSGLDGREKSPSSGSFSRATGDDDVVETVTPDRANDALGIRVLPGRSVGRDDLTLR